jgi:hypothetical protein
VNWPILAFLKSMRKLFHGPRFILRANLFKQMHKYVTFLGIPLNEGYQAIYVLGRKVVLTNQTKYIVFYLPYLMPINIGK